MSRVVFLLEELSMKELLAGLLPRLLPELRFLCVVHEGWKDLEQSIPRKLRAWREPGVRFMVIRDSDGRDCREIKRRLQELCRQGGREDVAIRLACQELEAWYLGAPDALADEFEDESLRAIASTARFRDPDSVAQPSAALEKLVPSFQKLSAARRMGKRLSLQNASHSFRVTLDCLARMAKVDPPRSASEPAGADES